MKWAQGEQVAMIETLNTQDWHFIN